MSFKEALKIEIKQTQNEINKLGSFFKKNLLKIEKLKIEISDLEFDNESYRNNIKSLADLRKMYEQKLNKDQEKNESR